MCCARLIGFQIFTIPPKALERAENFDMMRVMFAHKTVWVAPDNWFFPFNDFQWDEMVRQPLNAIQRCALAHAPACLTTHTTDRHLLR